MCGLCIICKNESQQHASANMLSFLRQKPSTPTMHHFDIHHKSFSPRFTIVLLLALASAMALWWILVHRSWYKIIITVKWFSPPRRTSVKTSSFLRENSGEICWASHVCWFYFLMPSLIIINPLMVNSNFKLLAGNYCIHVETLRRISDANWLSTALRSVHILCNIMRRWT